MQLKWRNSGRPRHGPVSDDMRRSRLQFKYSLKQCQRNEDQARADAMAESMRNHDMKSFWKDVSSTSFAQGAAGHHSEWCQRSDCYM